MNRLPLALLSLVGFFLLSGCGGPGSGDSCDGGDYVCQDDAQALECRNGTWRPLACRGPLGCREQADSVRCDTSLNQENDGCATNAEGKGVCSPNGAAILTCQQGVLVKTEDCSSCAVQDSQVVCQP
ncbi:hypothetical protein HJC10_30790 [Corallococcus exiguus]|uniref:hypothetical protein n=1 Tax=Corallococcus TaxID=83461 RepID=UPI000EB890E7|nr:MULTISPECIES: hypothetical protein [Corallococcus]NNB90594.1 hypothetical protein [Corallococcus exiguus]NNB97405.1 hypothetical protein [Corallococcus exiguus]NNC07225.1 hypothetical protein [Corallococcus exiguus]NPC51346.1 hypothetical protein [Corallococcus exiguus]RKH81293.1 hypothetical protein D7X99_19465 [Corallococcus sp. AB032C]